MKLQRGVEVNYIVKDSFTTESEDFTTFDEEFRKKDHVGEIFIKFSVFEAPLLRIILNKD